MLITNNKSTFQSYTQLFVQMTYNIKVKFSLSQLAYIGSTLIVAVMKNLTKYTKSCCLSSDDLYLCYLL